MESDSVTVGSDRGRRYYGKREHQRGVALDAKLIDIDIID
jgi:hypothetical protein